MTSNSSTIEGTNSLNSSRESRNDWTFAKFENTCRTSIGSNSLDQSFYNWLSTLKRLGDLPADHDMYVTKDVTKLTSNMVAYLLRSYDVALPKLLPENDECLSLTWENDHMKKFLSVYEDSVDLTHYIKSMNISCHEFLCEDDEIDLDKIGIAVSESGRVSSKTF